MRIDHRFRLRTPLSHIGEVISTVSSLVEEPVLQPDGSVEPVFSYGGNAWRGHLRDCGAAALLDLLGSPRLSLESFQLLFSGGSLSRSANPDIGRLRRIRELFPLLSLWGCGLGDTLMPGKLRVGNAYPVVAEAMPCLPDRLHNVAAGRSYRRLAFQKEMTRRDDGRDVSLHDRLDDGARSALAADRADHETATQMRFAVEMLAAGSELCSVVSMLDPTALEIGAYVSAIERWSRTPHIGGMAARGCGMVDLEAGDLLAVNDGAIDLGRDARAALEHYREHVRAHRDECLELLGVS